MKSSAVYNNLPSLTLACINGDFQRFSLLCLSLRHMKSGKGKKDLDDSGSDDSDMDDLDDEEVSLGSMDEEDFGDELEEDGGTFMDLDGGGEEEDGGDDDDEEGTEHRGAAALC